VVEVYKQGPDNKEEEYEETSIGNELFPGSHHIRTECHIEALVLQKQTVDTMLEDIAALAAGCISSRCAILPPRRAFADQLVYDRLAGPMDGYRGSVQRTSHFVCLIGGQHASRNGDSGLRGRSKDGVKCLAACLLRSTTVEASTTRTEFLYSNNVPPQVRLEVCRILEVDAGPEDRKGVNDNQRERT
jgi:hypothetical protein